MNDSLSTRDFIRRSILEADIFQTALTWETALSMVVSLTVALLMGLLIYVVYRKTYRGVVYAQTFSMTLVGMSVLTCMVTLAISTNIVLSLGMVGALSIVRYRTAIKEPFDLMFLFWAITTGISVGAGMYFLTVLAAVFVIILVILLGRKSIGGNAYILVVRYTGDMVNDEIRRILKDRKYKIKSKTIRKEMMEMAIEVFIKNNNFYFTEQISALENVHDLTLVQYNGEYHG